MSTEKNVKFIQGTEVINSYLKTVRRYDVLSDAEEKELFKRYSEGAALAQGLNAVNFNGVVKEACEKACRVRAAAHASNNSAGKMSRHIDKLLSCLNADNALEVTHHHGESVCFTNASTKSSSKSPLFL